LFRRSAGSGSAPLKRLSVRFLFAVAVLGVAVNLAPPMRAGSSFACRC
jgi:hypothetical protein